MSDDNDPKAVLLHYLDVNRDAVLWKLEGLSDYDVRRPLTPTGTNLLGLVKHLAMVELGYFGEVFDRVPEVSVGWWASENARFEEINIDMYATAEQTRDEVVRLLVDAARNTTATFAALELDAPGFVPWWGPERGRVTLHRVGVHLLTDLCRHSGHADILREQIDGSAGLGRRVDNLPGLDADGWDAYRAELQTIAEQFR